MVPAGDQVERSGLRNVGRQRLVVQCRAQVDQQGRACPHRINATARVRCVQAAGHIPSRKNTRMAGALLASVDGHEAFVVQRQAAADQPFRGLRPHRQQTRGAGQVFAIRQGQTVRCHANACGLPYGDSLPLQGLDHPALHARRVTLPGQ